MAVQARLEHEVRKVDEAGRLSLGRGRAGIQYDINESADGTITLVPVTVIPTREVWLYRNPEAMAMVQQGIKEASNGEAISVGSFAQYADDSLDDEE